MGNKSSSRIYQIRVKGLLDSELSSWFDDLTIEFEDGITTRLTGPIVDESALFGLLKKIRDSGMHLLSVSSVEADSSDQ